MKHKFRLLAGSHIGKGPSGPNHMYNIGDMIEADEDLAAKFNTRLGRKFDPLHGEVAAAPPVSAADGLRSYLAKLGAMNMDELQALADAEDIDMKGVKTKDDALARVKKALLGQVAA